MIEWQGYAPDLSEKTPGVFVECSNVIPTLKGFSGAPTPQSTLLTAAVAATVQGAANLSKLDGTVRFFAGTTAKLYEASATSWTDRTRAVGGDYSPAATVRWRFAQQNDVSFAATKSDLLQFSSSGAFADVAGSPKASTVATVGAFVFLFNTNEGTYSDSLNRWWCSALGDYTDWTPSVATQCATGILTATPGTITAGKRFGEAIIAYKQRSMYLGVYVGPPAIWEFRLLPEDAGTLSQEAVVDIGEAEAPKHIFMGYDDFYVFDGARSVPIGDARIKETVFNQLDRSKQSLSIAVHDRTKSNVHFYYPSKGDNLLDKCVVYNYHTNKWGRDDRQIQFAAEVTLAGSVYSDAGTLYSTYDSLPDTSYGSAFISGAAPFPGIFNTSNELKALTGVAATSSITSGSYGDDDVFSGLYRVKIGYERNPASATMTNFYKLNSGDTLISDATTQEMSARFDVLRSARWHSFQWDFTGDWEAVGHRVGAQQEANE
jgi:hypothetical protein